MFTFIIFKVVAILPNSQLLLGNSHLCLQSLIYQLQVHQLCQLFQPHQQYLQQELFLVNKNYKIKWQIK
jgi:hypothetical protein